MTPSEIAKQIVKHAERTVDFGFKIGVIRPNREKPGLNVNRWSREIQSAVKEKFISLMKNEAFAEQVVTFMQQHIRGLHTPRTYFIYTAFKAGEQALAEATGWNNPKNYVPAPLAKKKAEPKVEPKKVSPAEGE